VEAARPAIEHRSSRAGRWLRVRRLKLALWLAVVEGLLLVTGVLGFTPALVAAAVLVAFHLAAGRRLAWDAARQASWIAATSQVLVALLPALLLALGALAVVLVLAGAAILLLLVFASRR
jgi:hypothetical protein